MGVTRLRDDQMQGEVQGPGSSTDNAIARFDGTSGKIIQNSGVSINDSNNLTGVNILGATEIQAGVSGISSSGPISASSSTGTFNDIDTDNIGERTPAAGVTIDGVLLKDGGASGSADLDFRDITSTGSLIADGSGLGGKLKIAGGSGGYTDVVAQSSASGTLTLPSATDTLVGRATTDTLTNKTLDMNGAADGIILDADGDTTISAPTDDQIDFEVGGVDVAQLTSTGLEIAGGLSLSNALNVSDGGTGNTSLTSGNVLVGAGTSPVTTTKAAPTGDFVGTSDTQTLTNKTLTTPTIAQINNSTGVLLQLDTQTDNSNSISSAQTAGLRIQMGWSQVEGGGAGTVTETITFPTAFSTVLGVHVSHGAGNAGAAVSSITGLTTEYANTAGLNAQWSDVSTTGFRVTLGRTSGTFGVGSFFGYSWIAWGT